MFELTRQFLVKIFIDWHVISEDRYTVRTIPISINIILSSFVFLRLYLLCRFMALHSKQFQDAATRSIAALNRITVDFDFVLKTMISEHPIRVLLLFTGILWIVMAWLFCQCERYNGQNEGYLFTNSIWFIIITFLSVGYGDVTPRTFCGRGVALTTGILGAGVSSALIAVISRHMELTRAEKQVNNFMSDTKLEKQRKDVAAKVLQYRWFIHKYCGSKRSIDRAKLRNYQRKFLTAINEFKHVKWEQRKTAEEGNALMDLAKMQRVMHESLFDAKKQQESIINRLEVLNKSVQNLQHAMTLMNINS
ncbi:unnamed protein product [Soboliphyme baturini]|uniref:CaMBD domain-containing protein n=1 Tax=Soboliphyme baturini TaxID=241478 RepID=A0A183J141_9BILA|nr:unnamed protein product [Soboliphyme baturini]